MSEGPAAKRVALGHATALAGLTLQIVMQYAGKNDGVFVASVCRAWKNSVKSTFDDEITTHRSAGVMSLQRAHCVWGELSVPDLSRQECDSGERRGASWDLGKYSPRSVVREALADDSLDLSSDDLMQGIVASGRLKLFDDLWGDYVLCHDSPLLNDVLANLVVEATTFSHICLVAFLWPHLDRSTAFSCGYRSLGICAREGHVHLLEYFSLTDYWRSNSSDIDLGPIAAAHNQIDVLRWLRAHGQSYTESTAISAAAHGEVETINFLFENGCLFIDADFVACCVQYGRINSLQWCYDTLSARIPAIWSAANLRWWTLLAGHWDQRLVIKFLFEHGAEWPDFGRTFFENVGCYYHNDDGSYALFGMQ